MDLIHHPAFQSLVLPLLMAALGLLALVHLERSLATRGGEVNVAPLRFSPAGALLGLLVPTALLVGLDWPAPARVQKLTWIALAAAGLALWSATRTKPAPEGQPGPPAPWHSMALLWLLTCTWLAWGQIGWLAWGLAAVTGTAVLALLGYGSAGPVRAAVLSMAATGLALLAALGGSLLLAQLAMILACATAVPGAWAWLRPGTGLRVAPWLLQALGLMGLALAWTWFLSAPGQPWGAGLPLAVLASAFFVPRLLQRWHAASHPRGAPLAALGLAALPVALALLLQFNLPSSAVPAPADGDADLDDPYYTPRWP